MPGRLCIEFGNICDVCFRVGGSGGCVIVSQQRDGEAMRLSFVVWFVESRAEFLFLIRFVLP